MLGGHSVHPANKQSRQYILLQYVLHLHWCIMDVQITHMNNDEEKYKDVFEIEECQ